MPSRGVAESDFDMCYWVVSVSIQVVMYQNASFSTYILGNIEHSDFFNVYQ